MFYHRRLATETVKGLQLGTLGKLETTFIYDVCVPGLKLTLAWFSSKPYLNPLSLRDYEHLGASGH